MEFKSKQKNLIVFNQNQIRNLFPDFDRHRLKDWQEQGYIKKIIKGYYIFTDLKINDAVLYHISNQIYEPSYISFELALSHYGLIPEAVAMITAASTNKTKIFQTPIGNFYYHSIKASLFFGYQVEKINSIQYKFANPTKAVLDYLYINADIKDTDDFENMRFDKQQLQELIDIKILEQYLEKFSNKRLSKTIDQLRRYMND